MIDPTKNVFSNVIKVSLETETGNHPYSIDVIKPASRDADITYSNDYCPSVLLDIKVYCEDIGNLNQNRTY